MSFFFFFNDTATTEIYTLSLHDALPIYIVAGPLETSRTDYTPVRGNPVDLTQFVRQDRKSTRLNSSHSQISYAVFCLKKKKETTTTLFGLPAFSTHYTSNDPQ